MLESEGGKRSKSRPPSRPPGVRFEIDKDAAPRDDTVRLPTLDELAEDADLATAVEEERKTARARVEVDPLEKTSEHPTLELTVPSSANAASGSVAKDGEGDDEVIGDEVSSAADDSLDAAMAASSNYQRHYEVALAPLAPEMRASIAAAGTGADLFALAFDKDPAVARAVGKPGHRDGACALRRFPPSDGVRSRAHRGPR